HSMWAGIARRGSLHVGWDRSAGLIACGLGSLGGAHCMWAGIARRAQAPPLLKSCSLNRTLRVEHDFKGGRKLYALIPAHSPSTGEWANSSGAVPMRPDY
ncbi:hypothetical protein ACFRAM_06270, partial [Paenibacillus sp. NPDC056722]|uniref:hypothetical protein n=1 Tax=Paenibacillus sp. NPDC056722 TaxID=3345924 RepID=UPI0036915069